MWGKDTPRASPSARLNSKIEGVFHGNGPTQPLTLRVHLPCYTIAKMGRVPPAIVGWVAIALAASGYLQGQATRQPEVKPGPRFAHSVSAQTKPTSATLSSRALLDKYCVTCHDQRRHTAGLMLDTMDPEHVGEA